jgi:hypothetical protein
MDNAAATARQMWTLFEPVHVVSYFTPAARAAFEQAGLRGFWRGYFGGRAAPMGQVGAPAAVTAASGQLAAAAGNLDGAGHPLAAANLALPIPDEPVARLWHAATLLREHRGDGHVATLVGADLDGAGALALRAGVDQAGDGRGSHVAAGWKREQMQPARGWTDAEWDAADERLAARGLLDGEQTATAAGMAMHGEIEHATDQAAARPWTSLGQERAAALAQLLRPIALACATAMPFPQPGRRASAGRPDLVRRITR